jgi:hypothetical protein
MKFIPTIDPGNPGVIYIDQNILKDVLKDLYHPHDL